MDEATKVLVEEEKILRIGKGLKEWNGLDTGVFALIPLAFQVLRRLEPERQRLTLTGMVRELIKMSHSPRAIDRCLWPPLDRY
ncbi:MAG: hypothetical protein ACUVRH_03600 [Candidatus Bipolaricaulia bacterium]